MAYVINDNCVACGSCISECPVEAISEGDIYKIDADKCLNLLPTALFQIFFGEGLGKTT